MKASNARAARSKWLPFDSAGEEIQAVRAGKTVVQCHGTFDLVHPGHIYHLEEAKSLGDILVVTITGDNFVAKGPGRPYFDEKVRVTMLSALECVDYVVVVPYVAAVEAIECVRPDVYCKGVEYADVNNDPTGNIGDDVTTVERVGGTVSYVGSVVFSSTALLNRHFESTHASDAAKIFCRDLAARLQPGDIRGHIDAFKDLNVLIVGDVIFDRYSRVKVLGLTSKNRSLSARHLEVELQAGGSLAMHRHFKSFTPNVRLVSLAGNEAWVDGELGKYLGDDEDAIVRSPGYTTVVKHRFVEMHEDGREIDKLFSVNYLSDQTPQEDVQSDLLHRVRDLLPWADLVVVMDFGHGVMQLPLRELVQTEASFMTLNCQTNSYNYGYNLINRRYQRADAFSLDETEISLAFADRHLDFPAALRELQDNFGAEYAWLTRGDVDTIGLHSTEEACVCPPLEKNVIDTVGAGDAFCALASLSAATRLPIDLATFFGQVAGALHVRSVGNRDQISKGAFTKAATSLVTF